MPDTVPAAPEPESVRLLGVRVHRLRSPDLTRAVAVLARQEAHALVLNVNVHALNLAAENPWLRDLFNSARVVFADGAGVVLASRLLGQPLPERITCADWIWQLAPELARQNRSLYFLGAGPGVAEQAAERLRQAVPGLNVLGVRDGYFDKRRGSQENARVLEEIHRLGPDVLLVGFGMPLQERWLMENWTDLHVKVGVTVGGMFDFVSGRVRRSPKWMHRLGLEWLGRLLIEPRRLWRRYLIGNPKFAWRLLRAGRLHDAGSPPVGAVPSAGDLEDTRRVNVLGMGVSAVDMATALAAIERWIEAGDRVYVCVAAAHSVMDSRDDPELRRVFNHSGLTAPDGMSLVRLLQLEGGHRVGRVYGPDLLLQSFAAGLARGRRHYLYGGDAETQRRMEELLRARFPGAVIAGRDAPPFRELTLDEDEQAVRAINQARPDVLWVGLGSPKQERWMASHLGRVEAPVMIGVGAAFDFLSGRKPQAPLWIQRNGLEWLFRLVTEPRRLWPRYRKYPLFVVLALAQLVGLAHFPMDEGGAATPSNDGRT